jgi:hypothetical protein
MHWRPGMLAWALWALVVLAIAAVAWLQHLVRQAGRPELAGPDASAVPYALAMVSAATVGALLASRRPRHPVGWLLVALGLSLGATAVTNGYAAYALQARPGGLPAADYVERQQLRWLALAAGLTVVAALIIVPLVAMGHRTPLPWLSAACVALLPLATGAAILRYRLYDLDRAISRTLAYGLLTAAQTIQAFSARLRQQVDLDTLTAELLAVVDQTMQPTQVSLWLRPSVTASQDQSRTGASHAA